MKALLVGLESVPYKDILAAKVTTNWEIVCMSEFVAGITDSRDLADCDALISIRFDRQYPRMPGLKLLQAPSAGINSIDLGAVPAAASVCNAYGHEVALAEYNVMAMLVCARDLLRTHTDFSKGRWPWGSQEKHPMYTEIYDKTLCILGLGRIAVETARRAKALGMRVIACNRTTTRYVPEVDEISGLDSIARAVAQADFVIAACALTDETRNIVDKAVFDAMKETAYFINVGRSGLVSEADLYHALEAGRIAGAVLDVWYRYPDAEAAHPPPSSLPFHQLGNVVMTPHVAGWTDGMVDRRWSQIATNLDCLALGRPLSNVVRAGSQTG